MSSSDYLGSDSIRLNIPVQAGDGNIIAERNDNVTHRIRNVTIFGERAKIFTVARPRLSDSAASVQLLKESENLHPRAAMQWRAPSTCKCL